MRLAVLGTIVFVLVAVPAASAGSAASFAFGRSGGNIRPFSVTISRDGRVTANGAVQLSHPGARVPAAALGGLLRLAEAEGFFRLPSTVDCKRTLPDVAGLFVKIVRTAGTKKVSVRGGCKPGFAQLYAVLSAVAGVA